MYINENLLLLSNIFSLKRTLYIWKYFEYGLMLHYCSTGERISISDLSYQQGENKTSAPSKAAHTKNPEHVGIWNAKQLLLKMVEDGNRFCHCVHCPVYQSSDSWWSFSTIGL